MPNKAVSLAQFKLMQGVKHGSIHKPGLSPATASEFLGHQSPKGLPQKAAIHLKKKRHAVK